jgi:carbamoyltransferase
MKILGISDGMTGGAALLEDGKVVYAVHEERLIRQKMATGFPRQSITKLLADTRTPVGEIDGVAVATINEFFREPAVAYNGWLMREQAPLKELLLNVSSVVNPILGGSAAARGMYYRAKALLGGSRRRAIRARLVDEWGLRCPIEFIDHHLAHACSAYFTSGLDQASVITMDGAGDNVCSHVYRARDGELTRLASVESFASIGNYYAYVTHLCGFKAQRHEGKITGLAAYGKPSYAEILRRFVTYRDGQTVNTGKVFYWAAVNALRRALPEPFSKEDLASSVQQVLEEVCCAYVRHWVGQTACADVALAGGIFGNVKLNQRIHELPEVRSVFVHPGMGDEGLPVGAAFALAERRARETGKRLEPRRLDDVYFGPQYSEREVEQEIEGRGLAAERMSNPAERIAELLAQGRVVARFDGRMEYGPRALGNRTVLYQPTDPTVNDWLNQRLQRTEFMPFAPVTPREHAEQCYVGLAGADYTAQFMTITFDCTPWMKERCPAVVHVDGTARPQLIDRAVNPAYWGIVDEYRKRTGLPCVINTSFNMHEEPIVCGPGDAIRAFQEGHLDHLALGDLLLTHPDLRAGADARR